jgi:hypothetical protein
MSQLIHTHPLLFQQGDRLSREEFLERWESMPEIKNAELIDGIVYISSPVSVAHGNFDDPTHLLLSTFAARTPGCKCLPNVTWLMLESAPQPDEALYILPEYGGRVRVRRGFAVGAPELAAEISHSSRSYDLGPKLALYQRAEVREYVAVLIEERRIEWRILEQGSYRLMEPDSDGIFRSRVFPGLWVDSTAFWREDAAGLLTVLDQGLQSEEHVSFLESLQRRGTG